MARVQNDIDGRVLHGNVVTEQLGKCQEFKFPGYSVIHIFTERLIVYSTLA